MLLGMFRVQGARIDLSFRQRLQICLEHKWGGAGGRVALKESDARKGWIRERVGCAEAVKSGSS